MPMLSFLGSVLFASFIFVNGQTSGPQTSPSAAAAYTPSFDSCPEDFSLVRHAGTSNQTLSEGEAAYISARKSEVLPGAWKAYLANVKATNTNLPAYVSDILSGNGNEMPTLGIAQSGGGLRAAIVGAGILNALDGRNQSAKLAGTGGLLQAASYLSALSGGSWLTTSLAQADFPTINDLIFGSSSGGETGFGGWFPNVNVFQPSNDTAVVTQYVGDLLAEIGGKHQAGFPVTFIDMWSRALARHFTNGTTAANLLSNTTLHGAGITYSSIANLSSFVSHIQPFPIVLANTNSVNGNKSNTFSDDGGLVPITNPIYEFNVYEMGSWDPMLSAFIPTKYLGTQNNSVCITGFDQASLIEATSSALFTQFNTSTSSPFDSVVGVLFGALNSTFPQPGVELDSAQYPNPFIGVASDTYLDTNEEYLSFVDGGHDAENIPIQPLLVKARNVDTIVVLDISSDDSQNFTNGRSMIATQNRTTFFPSSYSFPSVPTNTSTYVSQNLTTRPTFFGCNSTDDEPFVIYIANGGPPPGDPAVTNATSFEFNYPPERVDAMLGQAFKFATQGRPADKAAVADPEWPACLACAVVDRARARSGKERSGTCASCFDRYCWNSAESFGVTNPSAAAPKRDNASTRMQAVGILPVTLVVLTLLFSGGAL